MSAKQGVQLGLGHIETHRLGRKIVPEPSGRHDVELIQAGAETGQEAIIMLNVIMLNIIMLNVMMSLHIVMPLHVVM